MDLEWDLNCIKEYDFYNYFNSLNIQWHQRFDVEAKVPENFGEIFVNLHLFNFSLWHEEDEARREDVSDSMIARTKRNIDKFNQQRNDSIELLDTYIVKQLKIQDMYKDGLPLNSETPGSVIDRLSIISLKIYHMKEQTKRKNITTEHRLACQKKYNTLREQNQDLSKCLSLLIEDYIAGRKSIKVYLQFKMYNDPNLNPALYQNRNLNFL